MEKIPLRVVSPAEYAQRLKYVGALEMVLARNHFYRDSYRRLMQVCLGLILCIIILINYGIYEKKHVPTPVYFATTYDGTPITLISLSKPNVKPSVLLDWATSSAIKAYTFNFVNYRRSLQHSRAFFTRAGYLSFLKALKDSNNLDAVKNKKLVVYARIEEGSTPIILRDSTSDPDFRINGVYTWEVQVPMLLTYESSGQTRPIIQRIMLRMLIRRVSALESPYGVGIDSFVIREVI